HGIAGRCYLGQRLLPPGKTADTTGFTWLRRVIQKGNLVAPLCQACGQVTQSRLGPSQWTIERRKDIIVPVDVIQEDDVHASRAKSLRVSVTKDDPPASTVSVYSKTGNYPFIAWPNSPSGQAAGDTILSTRRGAVSRNYRQTASHRT